jgi:NAD(P)-dependent dehydrogenase (short-subunit alcohol dehydrogenase family)
MISMNRIALVTGANRGIGFEICRQLASLGLDVILTSRSEQRGHLAVERLQYQGIDVHYHPLDVTDEKGVEQVVKYVNKQFGRLDVLVNNAGIYLDEGVSVFKLDVDMFRQTLEVNTLGPFMLCKAFVPMMRDNNYGRVVNISSGYGAMTEMSSYVAAYRTSKVALNALTRIVASEVRAFNVMCPGWVRTEMGGPRAPLSVEQGADTAVWLATLPDDGPTDGFFRDRQPIDW